MTWAQWLKWAFNIDVETFSACGSTARVIAYIEDPVVFKKILTHLEARALAIATSLLSEIRAPPQISLFG
jgi:hypothetical protein